MIKYTLFLKKFILIVFFITSSLSYASALELKVPKIGGKSSGGINLNDAKTKFTKIFFESALD